MKKKLWLVTEYYYPIVTSTGYYVTEIAEYLASKDLDVNVICTNSSYNETEEFEIKKEEFRNNVHIYRELSKKIDKNNFYIRIVRLLRSSIRLMFSILKKVDKNDDLIVLTNPAFLIILMPIIKKIKKCEYNILVHDIFPENIAAIGKIKKNSFRYACLKKIFDKAYSSAKGCISIGRDMTLVLKNKNIDEKRISLITNWADIEDVFPIEKEKTTIIDSLNLKNKFVFQFAGNLGHAQGLENILGAIKLMRNENIHFLFIGGGAKYETIENFILTNKTKNTSLIGFQDRSKQNDFLNACDVSIVTLNDGMFGLGVPSKSYNIMATGKPIVLIADENSEIALCINEYHLGWIVQPNNSLLLSQCFEKIYEERRSLSKMKKNIRSISESVFAKQIILEKYFEYLKN